MFSSEAYLDGESLLMFAVHPNTDIATFPNLHTFSWVYGLWLSSCQDSNAAVERRQEVAATGLRSRIPNATSLESFIDYLIIHESSIFL